MALSVLRRSLRFAGSRVGGGSAVYVRPLPTLETIYRGGLAGDDLRGSDCDERAFDSSFRFSSRRFWPRASAEPSASRGLGLALFLLSYDDVVA